MDSKFIFNAIYTFIADLDQTFGDASRPLKLYAHLLGKVTLAHTESITKNVQLFKDFCISNRNAIIDRSSEEIASRLTFSEKAYVDFELIFSIATTEQRGTIWQHLLTICALVDPASKAKRVLHSLKESSSDEGEVLNNIIAKIEKNVSETESKNPLDAVTKMLSSGVFTELITDLGKGIESGALDMNKLMSMVGGATGGANPDIDLGQLAGMFQNIGSVPRLE